MYVFSFHYEPSYQLTLKKTKNSETSKKFRETEEQTEQIKIKESIVRFTIKVATLPPEFEVRYYYYV